MGLMPAWRGGESQVFALKAICLLPGNPARGLDTHQGTVTLFDGETGVPTAILDASAITEIRTAAVTAVATDTLAREDARVLAIIGAGVQARAHLDALRTVRDFDEIRVYAPTAAHAAALGVGHRELRAGRGPGRRRRGHRDELARAGARGASGWRPARTSTRSARARPTRARSTPRRSPPARCSPTAASPCATRRASSSSPSQEGLIAGEEHVRAELGEVLAGLKPGRQSDEELTLFRSLGLAVEDLAAAVHAVAAARRRPGDRGRAVIPLREIEDGPRADRRTAIRTPLVRLHARGRTGRDPPEAREPAADRLVQGARRDQRDQARARIRARQGPRHRERRQHGPGRRVGGARARRERDDRRAGARARGEARGDRATRRAGAEAPLRRVVERDRDAAASRGSRGCSCIRCRTRA